MPSQDFKRSDRIADLLKVEISQVLSQEVKDPRVQGITVLNVMLTPDMKKADILISQSNSFNEHIEAAIELKIPLIIHSRNAEKETFEILNSYKNNNLKILMHCFTGSFEFSKKLLTLDAFFSASGIITFKNSLDLQETFKTIPLEKILIETDSPYLAPIPMRGKKNEPSYIKYTLKKLASLRNLQLDKIESLTTENFDRLFLRSK